MDLGKPIGANHTVPTGGFDQGEHGAGIGLSGGHGQVNSHNTQAGIAAAEQGHSHHSHHHHQHGTGASTGGIPSGTPIADKFTSQGQGQNSVAGAYAGGATDDGLTGQSNAHRTGAGVGYNGENLPTSSASAAGGAGIGSHSHSTGVSDNTVSGAYAGGGTRDALTGESHAQRTGAGVGPLGENLGHSGHSHATDAALASTATGAAVGAGAIAGSHSGAGVGVGPSGGAGGHYTTESTGTGNNLTTGYGTGTGNDSGVGAGGLASGTGASGAGVLDAQRAGAQAHREGHRLSSGTAAGVGAGALGAGAVGAGSSGLGKGDTSTSVPSANNERGAPIVDPKELDHGGRHGLIFDQATGKYVHRHEVEEGK